MKHEPGWQVSIFFTTISRYLFDLFARFDSISHPIPANILIIPHINQPRELCKFPVAKLYAPTAIKIGAIISVDQILTFNKFFMIHNFETGNS